MFDDSKSLKCFFLMRKTVTSVLHRVSCLNWSLSFLFNSSMIWGWRGGEPETLITKQFSPTIPSDSCIILRWVRRGCQGANYQREPRVRLQASARPLEEGWLMPPRPFSTFILGHDSLCCCWVWVALLPTSLLFQTHTGGALLGRTEITLRYLCQTQ